VNVDVARNLEALQPEQYLLAFVFLGSYAFALGHLFERRGRTVCAVLASIAAVSFIACCNPWEQGVMLVALALVGIGAFSGSAWLFWTLATWRDVWAARRARRAALQPPPAPVPRPRASLSTLVRPS
jgi:hypothetical protein